MGIDLSEFYKSVEWDILGVPAARFLLISLMFASDKEKDKDILGVPAARFLLISLMFDSDSDKDKCKAL